MNYPEQTSNNQIINYDQYTRSQKMSYDYLFKCIIVGDSGVGKSSLLLQFTDKKFTNYHEMTIGVEFGSKLINIKGKLIKLQVWDTAGQESFRSITRSYYKDAGVVLLVYDVSNLTSFISLETWFDDIKDMANNPHIILVGNKSDLSKQREVPFDTGLKFAESKDMLFIETSAKDTSCVDEAFVKVATQTLEAVQRGEIDITDPSQGVKPGMLIRPVVSSTLQTQSTQLTQSTPIDLTIPTPSKQSGYCCQ
jgi:Ras-related protein Rab-2A